MVLWGVWVIAISAPRVIQNLLQRLSNTQAKAEVIPGIRAPGTPHMWDDKLQPMFHINQIESRGAKREGSRSFHRLVSRYPGPGAAPVMTAAVCGTRAGYDVRGPKPGHRAIPRATQNPNLPRMTAQQQHNASSGVAGGTAKFPARHQSRAAWRAFPLLSKIIKSLIRSNLHDTDRIRNRELTTYELHGAA